MWDKRYDRYAFYWLQDMLHMVTFGTLRSGTVPYVAFSRTYEILFPFVPKPYDISYLYRGCFKVVSDNNGKLTYKGFKRTKPCYFTGEDELDTTRILRLLRAYTDTKQFVADACRIVQVQYSCNFVGINIQARERVYGLL